MPRILLHHRQPVSGDGEADDKVVDLLAHYKQLVNYGSQILFAHPEIALLPIILTDGRTLLAGCGERESLASVECTLCETQFVLHSGEEIGRDFGLFWSMCNHVKRKCSLDLLVKRTPDVAVRVKRCIGHGTSLFVYDASLVADDANEEAPDPLYAKLKAIGNFALKVPKAGQGDSWHIEQRAIELLKKEQLLICCAFPILWDSLSFPF